MIYNKAELQQLMQKLAPTSQWKPYVYAPDAAIALDTTGDKTKTFSVETVNQSPFIWCAGLAKCDNAVVMAGADTIFGGVYIKFDDTSGLGLLGKSWILLDSLFGWGGTRAEPRELPIYLGISGSSKISGSLLNNTGGNVNVVLNFIGVKVA